MNRMRRLVALLLIFTLCRALFAQAALPEPYSPEEFAPWVLALRRGQIIAFGVFPISIVATTLLYDLGRFGVRSIQAGRIDAEVAPWFFAPPGVERFSDGERLGILLGAAGLSVAVAVVDHLLGRRERREPPRAR